MTNDSDLRYLDAGSVQCRADKLADFRVCTEDAHSLGTVEGVLISPSERRLAYLIVQSEGRFRNRRYLLPVGLGAFVDEQPRTLRIAARREEIDLERFRDQSVPPFTDEDVVTAMFAQAAA